MRPLDWSDVESCITCGALVPHAMRQGHEDWHDNIAGEAIRSARRLDQIEAANVIRVQADRHGGLVLDCIRSDQCSWQWDQSMQMSGPLGFTLADLLRIAIEHECPKTTTWDAKHGGSRARS